MGDALAELVMIAALRRQVCETSVGRAVDALGRCESLVGALDCRLHELAQTRLALRDERLRREHATPSATAIVGAAIEVADLRRQLAGGQRDEAIVARERAMLEVEDLRRQLAALQEREAEYRRIARRTALAQEHQADSEDLL